MALGWIGLVIEVGLLLEIFGIDEVEKAPRVLLHKMIDCIIHPFRVEDFLNLVGVVSDYFVIFLVLSFLFQGISVQPQVIKLGMVCAEDVHGHLCVLAPTST